MAIHYHDKQKDLGSEGILGIDRLDQTSFGFKHGFFWRSSLFKELFLRGTSCAPP